MKITYRLQGQTKVREDIILGGTPETIEEAFRSAHPKVVDLKITPLRKRLPKASTSPLLVMGGALYETVNALFAAGKQFESWFNRHFGWFFTNGMKTHRRYD